MSQKWVEARFETGAPGTELAAPGGFSTKQIFFPAISFTFDHDPAMLLRDDEMRNVHEPIAHVVEQFTPGWSMRLRAYPDSLAFLLKALLGAPVTTVGNGVITDLGGATIPASCYRHRWTAPYGASGSPQTLSFRVGMGDEAAAGFWSLRGCTCTGLEISTPDTGGVMVTATGKANYVAPIADPSLVPAYESLAIEPFLKAFAQLTSYLAGSAATESIGFGVALDKDHTRTMNAGSEWPDLIEFAEGVPIVSFDIEKRALDVDDWNALTNGTRFSMLTQWVHQDVIASSYPYKIAIGGTSSASLLDGGEIEAANRRRTPASYSGRLSRDAASSSDIEVVNATASYV